MAGTARDTRSASSLPQKTSAASASRYGEYVYPVATVVAALLLLASALVY